MFEIRGATLPDGSKDTLLIGGKKIIVKNKGCRYAENWIDGEGLIALPGLIDPHVHFRVPGGEHKEDWEHGVKAAIAGGVTTVFDMPNTDPPLTTQKRLARKKELVGERDIDYRFWFGATSRNFGEIKKAASDPRIIGVKVYMGSSTGNLLVTDENVLEKIFKVCAEVNLVVAVHAECEERMCQNRMRLGHAPEVRDHGNIRDRESEWHAMHQALRIRQRTGCKLYFCHLSTPTSVRIAADAKEAGKPVYVEVCPHHLRLKEEWLFGPGPSKNFYKVNPPLRSMGDIETLRNYVCKDGLVDVIGSDHAPHTRQEKMKGNYDDIPSGMPGTQTILPLVFQLVADGKMSIHRFVELTSANSAKIFGLQHKGKLEVAYDADIVLLDPKEEVLFRHQDMGTKCGWTPYVATCGIGAPKYVIAQGKIVKGGERDG